MAGQSTGAEANDEPSLSIEEGYDTVDKASSTASELNRKLAFAGIALIWVFKTEGGGRQIVPAELFLPGMLIAICLALDMLQYIVKSELWRIATKKAEGSKKTKFKVSSAIGITVDIFFWLKIATNVAAYVLLIRYLSKQVF